MLTRPDDALEDALQDGSVLDGRYRIGDQIGGGAMACVYRAEHLRIARPVVIKVLHAGLSQNREAVARFLREATTSGQLAHPNIVTVTDSGVLPEGRWYVVMEALEGETLADRLEREGQLPWHVAVGLLRELLAGLHHAHAHGIVHRSIRPDNIFLLRGDTEPRLKILGFGIAELRATLANGSRTTRGGRAVGTPLYMSPEQAIDGEITPASDLYSSTVVLFEMLTGAPPFSDEDPVELMKAHLHAPPPRLTERSLLLAVPDRLEDIVHRGLAKLATERISSAAHYLRLLDELKIAEIRQRRVARASSSLRTGELAAVAPLLQPPPPPPSPPPQSQLLDSRMMLAKAYYKLKRYEDAIAQWQQVLKLDPSNERARKNLELASAIVGGSRRK